MKETARSWLLFVALCGILISMFWGYVFEDTTSPGVKLTSSCPFAKSNSIVDALQQMPDLPTAESKCNLQLESCPSCIMITDRNLLLDFGEHFNLIATAGTKEFTSAEMVKLLGTDRVSSRHAVDAVIALLKSKFPNTAII